MQPSEDPREALTGLPMGRRIVGRPRGVEWLKRKGARSGDGRVGRRPAKQLSTEASGVESLKTCVPPRH